MSKRSTNPINTEETSSEDNAMSNVKNNIIVGDKSLDVMEMAKKKEEIKVACEKNEIRQRRCSHSQS